MLKKISNSLSTDNSIPIFGYSINEADITSASFFCIVTLLYFVLLPYFTRLCCVLSPLLCPKSHFTDKAAAFVTLPSDRKSESFDLFYNSQLCPTFGHAVQKGLSRVQKGRICTRESNDVGKNPQSAPVLPYTMNETAPKGTASFYVSAVRRLPCYVINYFLAALAAFLFSFHTYASYIIGVPMKMEA